MTSRAVRIAIALFAVAVVFRLAFFLFALRHIPFTWDEGWPSLMAMHILEGEFPVVYWGQTYMGTQESYFQAVCIALLGAKTWVVRLYPFLFGLLYVLATWLVARRYYGERVGLLALAIAAIPVPYVTMGSVLIPPDNYLALVALGSVSLWLLHDLVYGGPERRATWRYVLLGFLLGYTFWLHILAVSYVGVALLFLFFRDKLLVFQRGFWGWLAGFVAGSLPLLWYNVVHRGATFTDVAQTTTLARSWEYARIVSRWTLQFLLGLRVMYFGDNKNSVELPEVLWWALLAAWIVALALVLRTRSKGLIRLPFLSLRHTDGTAILLVLVAATLFAFCRSARAGAHNVRYILPAMSAMPVLLALGLDEIGRRWRWALPALLAVVLGSQAWGNTILVRLWSDPAVVERDIRLPDTAGLRRFLREKGIGHAYANFWISYRITFESGKDVICAEPFNKRFPGREIKYLAEVRAATNAAYLFVTDRQDVFTPALLERFLRRGQAQYRKEIVDCFTVFYDIRPPSAPDVMPWRELPRAGWHVEANVNPGAAGRVADGNPATRWRTGRPQAEGDWVRVDLGEVQRICAVQFDPGEWMTDYPRGFRVEISGDGAIWTPVAEGSPEDGGLLWCGPQPCFLMKGDTFNVSFPPIAARYVRVILTAPHRRWNWSIAELRILAPRGVDAEGYAGLPLF